MRPAATPAAAVGAPELHLYRDRTRALLRRYFRMSIELGRLPSLVGREFFRSRVTSYRMHTFEDAVIFVHDTETCLQRLDAFSQQLIARVVFQDYTFEETAALVGCGRRTVVRR
jgi:DNA-directed RNA polymerase specialized sigma24 family protein